MTCIQLLMAMAGMLVWHRTEGRYLLLRRSPTEETTRPVSGNLAPVGWSRERASWMPCRGSRVRSWGLDVVRIEYLLGAAHFYRGEPVPENEMVGVTSAALWPTRQTSPLVTSIPNTGGFLPPDPWLTALILRAEAFRQLMPVELRRLHWEGDLEF